MPMEEKNHVWEIVIIEQAGEPQTDWDCVLLRSAAGNPEPGLLDLLRNVKSVVDAKDLKVNREGATEIYTGIFTTNDIPERTWAQRIDLTTGIPLTAGLTFDVPDFFTRQEIQTASPSGVISKLIDFLLVWKTESLVVEWLE